jgi:hypothetical protein
MERVLAEEHDLTHARAAEGQTSSVRNYQLLSFNRIISYRSYLLVARPVMACFVYLSGTRYLCNAGVTERLWSLAKLVI